MKHLRVALYICADMFCSVYFLDVYELQFAGDFISCKCGFLPKAKFLIALTYLDTFYKWETDPFANQNLLAYEMVLLN